MKRPIIFITGKGDIPTSVRAMKAGAIDFLTKPPRKREVLSHVVAGRLNKQIAGGLGTVEKTNKVHRARGIEKLGPRTVADLVRFAERAGILIAKHLEKLDRQLITFDIPTYAP